MDEEDDDDVTFASSDEESEDDQSYTSESKSNYTNKTVHQVQWKPMSETTYETLVLTNSEFNSKVRGAGFRTDGKAR